MTKTLTVQRGGQSFHKPQVPAHIVARYGSARKWKAQKRAECRAALAAVRELRMGSAFFPRPVATQGDSLLDKIQAAVTELEWRLSRKVWGR